MVTLRADFDEEQIRLDELFDLKPFATVWPDEDPERAEWTLLAMRGLEGAYGEDEPEYSLDIVKLPIDEEEPPCQR